MEQPEGVGKGDSRRCYAQRARYDDTVLAGARSGRGRYARAGSAVAAPMYVRSASLAAGLPSADDLSQRSAAR
jgi:hypothetical protein